MTELTKIIETPVTWLVEEIEVNATLTIPPGNGPFPAVLMVAGSGPTDRNWNSPLIPGTNGSAALLARVLNDAGYVTLRYDKRASGANTNVDLSLMMGKISKQGHVDELAGGMKLLASHKDVDKDHIFALTNSEGCLHAMNYQLQAGPLPFAGLLLTSAPARPVGEVAHSQIAAQLAAVPGGEKILASYDQAISDFLAGKPVKIDESLPEGLRDVIMSVINPINQPFSRELWMMDVSKLIVGIHEPVLILLGKKDIQVVWQTDGPIFEGMVEKQANIKLAYAENANHVLKYEPKPLTELTMTEIMYSYNPESGRLDDQAVETITSWLRSQI